MDSKDIKNILEATFSNKKIEVGCDDCEERMDEYATLVVENKELGKQLELIKIHIDNCCSCREEFETLLLAVESSKKARNLPIGE